MADYDATTGGRINSLIGRVNDRSLERPERIKALGEALCEAGIIDDRPNTMNFRGRRITSADLVDLIEMVKAGIVVAYTGLEKAGPHDLHMRSVFRKYIDRAEAILLIY